MVAAIPPLLWRPLGVLSLVAARRARGRRAAQPRRARPEPLARSRPPRIVGIRSRPRRAPARADGRARLGRLRRDALLRRQGRLRDRQTIVPFRDLLVAGERIIYAEAGTSFVGAALDVAPRLRPHALQRGDAPDVRARDALHRVRRSSSATARCPRPLRPSRSPCSRSPSSYPSWVTETPPAAFALPLAFSLHRVWRDELARAGSRCSAPSSRSTTSRRRFSRRAARALARRRIVERNRRRPDFRRLAAIGASVLALGAAAVIGLLFAFAGWYATLANRSRFRSTAPRASATATSTLTRSRSRCSSRESSCSPSRSPVPAPGRCCRLRRDGLASWFVAGYGFDIALGTAIFVAALLSSTAPGSISGSRSLPGRCSRSRSRRATLSAPNPASSSRSCSSPRSARSCSGAAAPSRCAPSSSAPQRLAAVLAVASGFGVGTRRSP